MSDPVQHIGLAELAQAVGAELASTIDAHGINERFLSDVMPLEDHLFRDKLSSVAFSETDVKALAETLQETVANNRALLGENSSHRGTRFAAEFYQIILSKVSSETAAELKPLIVKDIARRRFGLFYDLNSSNVKPNKYASALKADIKHITIALKQYGISEADIEQEFRTIAEQKLHTRIERFGSKHAMFVEEMNNLVRDNPGLVKTAKFPNQTMNDSHIRASIRHLEKIENPHTAEAALLATLRKLSANSESTDTTLLHFGAIFKNKELDRIYETAWGAGAEEHISLSRTKLAAATEFFETNLQNAKQALIDSGKALEEHFGVITKHLGDAKMLDIRRSIEAGESIAQEGLHEDVMKAIEAIRNGMPYHKDAETLLSTLAAAAKEQGIEGAQEKASEALTQANSAITKVRREIGRLAQDIFLQGAAKIEAGASQAAQAKEIGKHLDQLFQEHLNLTDANALYQKHLSELDPKLKKAYDKAMQLVPKEVTGTTRENEAWKMIRENAGKKFNGIYQKHKSAVDLMGGYHSSILSRIENAESYITKLHDHISEAASGQSIQAQILQIEELANTVSHEHMPPDEIAKIRKSLAGIDDFSKATDSIKELTSSVLKAVKDAVSAIEEAAKNAAKSGNKGGIMKWVVGGIVAGAGAFGLAAAFGEKPRTSHAERLRQQMATQNGRGA